MSKVETTQTMTLDKAEVEKILLDYIKNKYGTVYERASFNLGIHYDSAFAAGDWYLKDVKLIKNT